MIVVVHWGGPARGDDDPPAVRSLDEWVPTLKHQDARTRARAASALGRMGERARPAVPALIEALKDADGSVRTRSAIALWRAGGPLKSALPVLLAVRNDPDEEVRSEADAA